MQTYTARIAMTGPQAEAIEWALGAMDDYWCTAEGARERGEALVLPEGQLPRIARPGGRMSFATGRITWKRYLVLTDTPADVLLDLRYRMLEQLPDMVHSWGLQPTDPERLRGLGQCRAGANAWRKITRWCPGLAKLASEY